MQPDLCASRAEIDELCRRYGVAKLSIFASIARGDCGADSDDDLAVVFQEMTVREYYASYFGLLFALEDLTSRKVDLVDVAVQTRSFFLSKMREESRLIYAA